MGLFLGPQLGLSLDRSVAGLWVGGAGGRTTDELGWG